MTINIGLSKTKYCGAHHCSKIPWLFKNIPHVRKVSADEMMRIENGNEVGELAKGLFDNHIDVTVVDENGIPDTDAMIVATADAMKTHDRTICEAAFDYKGLYCAVDALVPVEGGWVINEVKSTTNEDKKTYYNDVAYQKYVLEHCGVNVVGVNLVYIDHDYVLDGELDINQLFAVADIAAEAEEAMKDVEGVIETARKLCESAEEPETVFCAYCNGCGFKEHCLRHLPSPNVFDLYGDSGFSYRKKAELANDGYAAFEDLKDILPTNSQNKRIRMMHIEHTLYDKPDYIDAKSIKKFVSGVYENKNGKPLYVLDFETVQPPVPRYQNSKPYAQIPFQYSLHIIHDDGELEHREFLAQPEDDPRRPIAEALVRDIPDDVVVFVYNKKFECERLKELAGLYPDLSEHLLKIRDNIVDLLVPFSKGWYYNRAMGGSFSIKYVLPALFPNDERFNYKKLGGNVHNGTEAMTVFPAMEHMDEAEREATRKSLLEYCCLDTYALVMVWQKLCEAADIESE